MRRRAASVLATHGNVPVRRDAARRYVAAASLVAVVAAIGCKVEGNGQAASIAATEPAASRLDASSTKTKPTHCRMLVAALCAQFGDESGVCRQIGSRLQRYSEPRCDAMLAHYDQVAKEARAGEERKQALLAAHAKEPIGHPPWFGPADAIVTLVVFTDLTCRECARGSPVAQQIRNRYPGVRFVFRHFAMAEQSDAHRVAEASLAAHAQGKFWEYHDVLFSNQHDLSDRALERYAKEVGLDLGRFRRALKAHQYAADVDADQQLANQALVNRPPAMFVNGEPIDFAYDVVALDEAIEKAKLER